MQIRRREQISQVWGLVLRRGIFGRMIQTVRTSLNKVFAFLELFSLGGGGDNHGMGNQIGLWKITVTL